MPESAEQAPPEQEAAPPPRPTALPWEAPGAGIREFFLTMYGIMARPSWALSAPPGGLWPRWVGFTLIIWFLVILARHLFSWAWSPEAGGLTLLLWSILAILLQAAIFLPMYSGAVFLALNLLRRGAYAPSFPLVLRAVCYSQVSTAAMLLPVVGIIVHFVWNVVLLTIALKAGLGLPTRAALLGVTLPLLGFFLLGVLLASIGLGLQ